MLTDICFSFGFLVKMCRLLDGSWDRKSSFLVGFYLGRDRWHKRHFV